MDRGDDGLPDGIKIIVIGGLVQKLWLNWCRKWLKGVPLVASQMKRLMIKVVDG